MHSYLLGNPSLVEAVRSLESLGAKQFDLYFLKKTATQIAIKNQEVDSLTRAEDVGLSIRVLREGRMGFSFTTSLEVDAIRRATKAAWDVSQIMPEDPHHTLASLSESVYPAVDTLDSKGLETAIERKIELAKQLERECRAADKRIQTVRQAALGETHYEMHLVDSHGEHLQHLSTLYSASITCKAEQDGDSQMGGDFGFSNELSGLDVTAVGRQAAEYATELLGAKQPPTLQCPAVLRNSVVADLIDFLAPSFSAEQIDKGRSMLAGRQGQRVFSEAVTLIDDGLLPGGYATSPFDGEGTPSRRNTLIEGGFFQEALYDLYYAKKHGVDPTGSASRGIKAPPSISTTNLFLKPGKKSLVQLCEGISQGILITDLMGVHTANPVTGDFSLGASGILIENGKLTRPVKGFAVAGNILGILQGVTDTGADLRFFGSTGAPSVRVREISVGGV
jgi:PmbA protein